jgi:hypothetical protein
LAEGGQLFCLTLDESDHGPQLPVGILFDGHTR